MTQTSNKDRLQPGLSAAVLFPLPNMIDCEDETLLGLKTIGGKNITIKGVKPKGCVQWKRDNFYLYGAVEVTSGESYFYEFYHLDSQ